MSLIYKIVPQTMWQEAEKNGVFKGAPVDHADGFIHFSCADQLAETANKHFKGMSNLLLITVEREKLGDNLQMEVSRGGALFPHLYDSLKIDDVISVEPYSADENGIFYFPEG